MFTGTNIIYNCWYPNTKIKWEHKQLLISKKVWRICFYKVNNSYEHLTYHIITMVRSNSQTLPPINCLTIECYYQNKYSIHYVWCLQTNWYLTSYKLCEVNYIAIAIFYYIMWYWTNKPTHTRNGAKMDYTINHSTTSQIKYRSYSMLKRYYIHTT